MIPVLGTNIPKPRLPQLALFGLLVLCGTVDWPRAVQLSGNTLLGPLTLASCGIIWAVFLLQPVLPNHLLKAVLFLIFFEVYCSFTMVWANTGVDGVQMLTVGLSFLGLILLAAREADLDLVNGITLHRVILGTSVIAVGVYSVVVMQEQKLGDGLEGLISNRAFALYALPIVAVALAGWRSNTASKAESFFSLMWAVVVTFTVALSMSRTALICCLIMFPLALFLRLDKKSIALSLIILIGGGALFAVAVMSYQPLYDRFFAYDASMKVGGIAVNASGRTKIWQLVIQSIGDGWIFGNGVASSQILVRNSIRGVGQPHNDYIRYYYDTGVFGLFLYFCFCYAFVTRTVGNLLRSIRQQSADYSLHVAALLSFVAISGSMLTDNSVCYSFVMMPFGVLLGCSLGAGISQGDNSRRFEVVFPDQASQPLKRNIRMV